jgi:hypothetical protein
MGALDLDLAMFVRAMAFGFPVALIVATQPPEKPLLLFVLFALVHWSYAVCAIADSYEPCFSRCLPYVLDVPAGRFSPRLGLAMGCGACPTQTKL